MHSVTIRLNRRSTQNTNIITPGGYNIQQIQVGTIFQAIVKACESLAASGQIKEKVYGKQKVYVADQSQFPEVIRILNIFKAPF